MADKVFTNWLIIKSVETKFWEIKKLSFKVEEFKEFLDTYDKKGWVNVDILKNKEGKEYAVLNDYQPKAKEETKEDSDFISIDELPF